VRDCLLCGSVPADVVVHIEYRVGDGFALPAEAPVCGRCHELIGARAADELADRLSADYDDPGTVARHVIDRAGVVAPWTEVPSTVEGERRGFVPLASITGVGDVIGPLWPEEHRLARQDLGDRDVDPDDAWLVRSPWPSMSASDVLMILWPWVEQEPYPHERGQWVRRVNEVFAWDEQHALERLRSI
jgi:hypothetical protein